MSIKLIALDIDGTTIDRPSGVFVHEKVREAVRDAREVGIKVCLSSARPCYYMQDATDGLDGVDALVGGSGAVIEKDGEIIFKKTMKLPLLLACFETAKRLDMYMSFAGNEKIYICQKGPVSPPLEYGDAFLVLNDDKLLEKLYEDEFTIAFVFTEVEMQKEEIFTDPEFELATIHKASERSFNLTDRGTDKGKGVLKLAESWGILSEEILAVGNDENDIPMLEMAGVGVAVANATPEVLKIADWVAPDVHQGGAADAIRRFAL